MTVVTQVAEYVDDKMTLQSSKESCSLTKEGGVETNTKLSDEIARLSVAFPALKKKTTEFELNTIISKRKHNYMHVVYTKRSVRIAIIIESKQSQKKNFVHAEKTSVPS